MTLTSSKLTAKKLLDSTFTPSLASKRILKYCPKAMNMKISGIQSPNVQKQINCRTPNVNKYMMTRQKVSNYDKKGISEKSFLPSQEVTAVNTTFADSCDIKWEEIANKYSMFDMAGIDWMSGQGNQSNGFETQKLEIDNGIKQEYLDFTHDLMNLSGLQMITPGLQKTQSNQLAISSPMSDSCISQIKSEYSYEDCNSVYSMTLQLNDLEIKSAKASMKNYQQCNEYSSSGIQSFPSSMIDYASSVINGEEKLMKFEIDSDFDDGLLQALST